MTAPVILIASVVLLLVAIRLWVGKPVNWGMVAVYVLWPILLMTILVRSCHAVTLWPSECVLRDAHGFAVGIDPDCSRESRWYDSHDAPTEVSGPIRMDLPQDWYTHRIVTPHQEAILKAIMTPIIACAAVCAISGIYREERQWHSPLAAGTISR